MKIIHQHPSTGDREEILCHLHTACLRALRSRWQTVQELPGSTRGR